MTQFKRLSHAAQWLAALAVCSILLSGCAIEDTTNRLTPVAAGFDSTNSPYAIALLNRVTWGANPTEAQRAASIGPIRFLDAQLKANPAPLPAAAQKQIDGMSITQTPMTTLVFRTEQQRKEADAVEEDAARKTAQQAYQKELTRLAREAASRMLLRALYSPNQLQEQMTWFWFNHFNVHMYKANVRAMVGDYEDVLRSHALGKFSDLLAATMRHPAMLRYLDNEQNSAGKINENYARELMELHTLGVGGGYSQHDVQELARVLTGLGVNLNDPATSKPPAVRPDLAAQYVRVGLFEFNPNRHDYGNKELLGQPIKGRGLAEVDEVAKLLAHNPATARFISRKLALYFVSDDPPQALLDRMVLAFRSSDGDMRTVLRTMFSSPEFAASLNNKFKDPMHYVVSSVRFAYDEKVILNPAPMLNWLNQLSEAPYNRQTPDGYPLTRPAWSGSGQMITRFEIAKAIGSGSAGLFHLDGAPHVDAPAFPQVANWLYFNGWSGLLNAQTQQALAQAANQQEWNTLVLSSPEFMLR